MSSRKGQLLYLLNDRQGLLFKKSAFFIADLVDNTTVLITTAPIDGVKQFLGHCRLMNRLLRLEPRCAEKLSDKRFIVCYAHKVWLLDIDSKKMTEVWSAREGFSNPLSLCSDDKYVYWGDYGNNQNRKVVNIYRIGTDLRIEVVCSFPNGTVRHIHNVLWNKEHQRFIILTGDLEEKSGIYISDSGWSSIMPIVTGKQQYRAVVAFPCGEGLVYATDSVSEKNNIYLLQGNEVKSLSTIPGSCIYGTETKDFYLFSTTVEPPEGRGLFDMFTYKLGTGINDRYSHLFAVRKSNLEVIELLRVKKDIWPMKLFQYGVIMFPNGEINDNNVWYYTIACKGDGRTTKLNISGKNELRTSF